MTGVWAAELEGHSRRANGHMQRPDLALPERAVCCSLCGRERPSSVPARCPSCGGAFLAM